jgi:putative ATP-binding cassette transporter
MNRFDRQLWRRFATLAKPYWFLEEKWPARGMVALLLVLLLAQTEFNVLFVEQSGELTSALAARDGPRFWRSIQLFLGILVLAVPIYAYYYYVRDKLGIWWRRWFTHRLLGEYFSDRNYYELNANPAIDNPDQRIAEDVNSFTQKSLSFLLVVASALLQLLAFSRVLWSISRPLVVFLVFYAAVGTLITFGVFGKKLMLFNFNQLKREADFRFSLVRIRENAESIAFYRGEVRESNEVKQRFGEVFRNFTRLIRWTLNLNLFQYGYSFLTIILPSVIIAPRVLSGELEVGRVVQAGGAFAAMLGALTVFVDNFESLSRFGAGIERLDTFAEFLRVLPERRPRAGPSIAFLEDSRLAFERVTLATPNYERTLVRDLSLAVHPGEGLLIVGVSGGGKSSLLRAIAGLWQSGSGTIVRPRLEDMLFLPQHAYMILGSLRNQLLYPRQDSQISDAELRGVLDRVNLPHLTDRCGGLDAKLDFAKVLSVGEQQRLAFARVLLAKPRFVMLDEATSALDADNEASLYRELKGTATTLVSVSHRPATLQYHEQVLELRGNGDWRVHSAASYVFNQDFAVE